MRTLLVWAVAISIATAASVSWSSPELTVRDELAQSKLLMGDPGRWQQLKHFLGLPYLFIAPEKSGEFRSNISVTPVGKTAAPPENFFEQTSAKYNEGRQAYLDEKAGTLVRFLQPRHLKRDPATEVHAFGYEYEMDGEKYHEETHYLYCGSGDLFILKGLSTEQSSSRASMKDLLETFHCARN